MNRFCAIALIFLSFTGSLLGQPLGTRLNQDCPLWMEKQIRADLHSYENQPFSKKELEDFYDKHYEELWLAKFTILDNKIEMDNRFEGTKRKGIQYRGASYIHAFTQLSKYVTLPDTVFLISLKDGLNVEEDIPLFVMAKHKSCKKLILIPDFEALMARYQVLKDPKDITQYVVPWETKKAQLIWRGSTAQKSYQGSYVITPDTLHEFSRVRLCELSTLFPSLLNAKFTFFAQGAEHIPYLKKLEGNRVSYDKQLQFKYHIFIDGNEAPYTASGWKFFTNSLIFKPESCSIQWYFNALKPNVHYVPLKQNLEDLIQKIEWAQTHDKEAEKLAQAAREFALTHITVEDSLTYLYHLLIAYNQLEYID